MPIMNSYLDLIGLEVDNETKREGGCDVNQHDDVILITCCHRHIVIILELFYTYIV